MPAAAAHDADACGYSVVATGHGETVGVGVPRVAVGSMLRISGRNHREVSRDVSRSQYLIRDIFNDKRGVRANTFAAIAEVCGFEVHLVADDGQDDVVLSGDAPWYVRYVYYKDGKPSRVAHTYAFATEDEAANEAGAAALTLTLSATRITSTWATTTSTNQQPSLVDGESLRRPPSFVKDTVAYV